MAGLALLCACLASGCVSLQQDGTITKVPEQDAGASQVQIWPSPPSSKESPGEIVSGFLEAARSGASNQGIAADYLSPQMRKTWQTEQNTVVVLADYSESTPQAPDATGGDEGPNNSGGGGPAADAGGDGGGVDVEQVQGTVLGQLDASGVYSAESRSATYDFGVQQTDAGYRISQLPDNFGVLMERSDFESFYSRHVVYYDNPQPPAGGKLLPTQVYLPSVYTDQQVEEQVSKLVVNGVPDRLAAEMQDSVTGAVYQNLQIDNSGTATVQIKGNGACSKSISPCEQLAQQLAQTLGGLSTKITAVAVDDVSSNRTTPAANPDSSLSDYGLGSVLHTEGSRPFYAVSLTGALETLSTSGQLLDKDVLAADHTLFHSVVAQPGSGGLIGGLPRLALVSQNQLDLYVPRQQNGTEQLSTVFPAAGTPAGAKVGQAGWDSYGNLWFTVTLNGYRSVYRYDGDSLVQVTVSGLNGTLDEVLPAPDGDRVAVRYTDADGDQSIIIAAVTETDDTYALNLSAPEVVASSWNEITEFDWYNEDSLAVLGMQPGSQELGLYQIYTDGSAVYDSLTSQPVQASPPSLANGFVWTAAGEPIATAPSQGKNTLYTLSVEGQDAQPLNSLTGGSPTY